ncbi:modification methylase [Bacillus haynesii]|uniref:DNA methyltransferase n=1 Tax=Bacillus haynesii TaxID=1925021 RepID=UPI00227EC545|nr:DNA methyltransferase [Bacillus haynesii]MCY7847979.1 modification methylase [Bacillus haynesii]MCY8536960.1 modification methylase [Bacillus haynesii]MCY9445182.1 modification methylase [Bacillus haynesii]MEC0635577.1 DNA methyltransferase [Bacillus haynesii]
MDTSLQKQLKSYGESYWNFDEFKRDGIHKIANYPAMMVAPMQYKLIDDIINLEENITNIFDPFHGSGTTLVEGYRLGLNVVGIDINPLANLITKVKLQGIDKKTIYNSNELLLTNIKKLRKSGLVKVHSFEKIDKWFRKDIIYDLSIIRSCIMVEKNKSTREYYWTCMSDLVRKYSNTRSSTFKLHIKEQSKIVNMENNLINEFVASIEQNINSLYSKQENNQSKLLIQGDSLLEMNKMEDNTIDFICTSPPYGDNGTTVTYGQYSILSLLWIDDKDLTINNEQLIKNFSAIDTSSLGGRIDSAVSKSEDIPSETLVNILKLISVDKQKKVKNFFNDYFNVLREMIRVLKQGHLMVLTLGNRRVDNKEIKLDQITKEFCINNGMKFEAEIGRNIKRKRIPKMVSHISNYGPVKSMNAETVLILRKG